MHIRNSPNHENAVGLSTSARAAWRIILVSHAGYRDALFTAASNCQKNGSFRTVLVGSPAVLRRRF